MIMYSVYENYDSQNRRNVFNTPDNWMVNRVLYWPPDSNKVNLLRKNMTPPDTTTWEQITSYKILARNLRKIETLHALH